MTKKFFTYAAAAAMTFSLIAPAPSLAAETEFTEVSPANAATDVYRNATLEAVVNNGEPVETVEFMQGDFKDFSTSGIKASANIAGEEKDATDENKAQLAADDGKYFKTSSEQGDSFQTFEIEVGSLEEGGAAEINWTGKTLPQSTISLSVWDKEATAWVLLNKKKADSADSKISFNEVISEPQFIDNGKMQVKIQNELNGSIPTPDDKFSLLWFTDTQFYAKDYPDTWKTMTDYMISEYKNDRYEYIVNTGDLVDTPDSETEWAVAKENLDRLDNAGIPYGVLAGNHDVEFPEKGKLIDYQYFQKYAGANRFEGKPWYGENLDDNRNHYDLMTFGEHEFIFLYLGYGKENEPETIEWANEKLAEHGDRNAILNMHKYLTFDGDLDPGIPKEVYEQVVKPNENVKLVLSGHFSNAKKKISTIENKDGTTREVLQVMGNHQNIGEGGRGYLRFIDFNPATEEIEFTTYSPVLNDYDHHPEDSFIGKYDLVDWEPNQEVLEKTNREVSTDYIAATIYSEKAIGVDTDISEEKASVEWKDLNSTTQYFWYMNAYDESGEESRSALYSFITGTEKDPVIPTPNPDPETPVEPVEPGDGGTNPDPGTNPGTGGGGSSPTPNPGNGGDPAPNPGSGGGTNPDPGTNPGTPGDGDPTPNPVPTPAPAPLSFTDVADKYMLSVTYLIHEDITNGYSSTQFGTDKEIKRIDAAVMLAKSLKLNTDSAPDSGFTDVPSDRKKYIDALKDANIINGKSAAQFGAYESITRGEMAIMLTRAHKLNAVNKEVPFSDVNERYNDAVAALLEYKITNGKQGNRFGTNDPIIRGDFAIFLYKLNAMY